MKAVEQFKLCRQKSGVSDIITTTVSYLQYVQYEHEWRIRWVTE